MAVVLHVFWGDASKLLQLLLRFSYSKEGEKWSFKGKFSPSADRLELEASVPVRPRRRFSAAVPLL